MTQKKNIASKLVLVLFVLTLLSCCLLGSTFARYVSGGNGSASVGIAKWDVDITGGSDSGTTAVEFEKLSPDITAAFSGTTDRVQATGKKLVATIENKSDVAATVTVGFANDPGMIITGPTGGAGISATNWSDPNAAASEWQIRQVLQIKLYWDDSETFTDGGECSGTKELVAATDGVGGGKIYIFAEATWTSMDKEYANENVADAIDTWIGENVTKISANITFSAVQASELPTT